MWEMFKEILNTLKGPKKGMKKLKYQILKEGE